MTLLRGALGGRPGRMLDMGVLWSGNHVPVPRSLPVYAVRPHACRGHGAEHGVIFLVAGQARKMAFPNVASYTIPYLQPFPSKVPSHIFWQIIHHTATCHACMHAVDPSQPTWQRKRKEDKSLWLTQVSHAPTECASNISPRSLYAPRLYAPREKKNLDRFRK